MTRLSHSLLLKPLTLFPLPLAILALAFSASAEEKKDAEAVIQDGSKVGIEYTLKLDDGEVVDTSESREPLVYQQGGSQILPALEAALAGLPIGAEKEVTLSAEDGYGLSREELFHAVPADQIPAEARTKGAQLMSQDAQGNQRPLRVHEVREDEIVLDLNHPLAGQTLHFDVKVVSIE